MTDELLPPEGLITTQEEIDECRKIVKKLPPDLLTPIQFAQLNAAIDRVELVIKVINTCRHPLKKLTAIVRGIKISEGARQQPPNATPPH